MSQSTDDIREYLDHSTVNLAVDSAKALWALSGTEPSENLDPLELSTYGSLTIVTAPIYGLLEIVDIVTGSLP